MTLQGWFILFLVIQVIHFLGTWRLYVKAGRKAWEAAIPIYNAVVLMDIINRPKWWTILLFLPVINLFMFPILWVETIRSFGRHSRPETFIVILTLGFYIYYVNYALDVTYVKDRSLKPRTNAGEWVSSIVFAIVAATLVHTYFMQPYVIPSSSLEKSLLIGDFLFVSKFHYGARPPMTTVAAPMVHDTIPVLKKKSYIFDDNYEERETSFWNKFQLPYMRLPGFQKIERNDIVVFNQPADTLKDMNNFRPDRTYYKPIDKKTNLVKRCVGIAGDSLQIIDGYVYINGKKTNLPDRAKPQYYSVVERKDPITQDFIDKYQIREYQDIYKMDEYKWNDPNIQSYINQLEVKGHAYLRKVSAKDNFVYLTGGIISSEATKLGVSDALNMKKINITDEDFDKIKSESNTISINKQIQPKGQPGDVFPHKPSLGWNTDNFGPIYIPKKGVTVKLDKNSLPFYKRIISEYEGNTLIVNGDEIMINGKITNDYTFKQNYYWMMGDNRQNSLDARSWGYVPFDHVVGKPVLIWFSYNSQGQGLSKVRWNRLFSTVGGDGKRVSYFPYVMALVAIWFGYGYFKKRKKKA